MQIAKSERLAVLSEAEQEALYGLKWTPVSRQ